MVAEAPVPETATAKSVARIMSVAYELFSRRGVRDVGVNELIERSGVAKATFYRHFPSKDLLVLAFLEQRDKQWTMDLILSEALRRHSTPREQLLAIFDVFGEWFQREDFEGCSFAKVLLEMGPGHPLGQASISYLTKMRGHIQAAAEEAGLVRPEEFAYSLLVLMKGAILQALEGDLQAAKRAQQMAVWLIEHHSS
ncbi:TetR/AcrR family transcriptional regulator [Arthrobacter sp. Z1-9]